MTTQTKIEYIKAVIESEKQIVASASLVSDRQSAQMRIEALLARIQSIQNT
jgi:hypothetical protein